MTCYYPVPSLIVTDHSIPLGVKGRVKVTYGRTDELIKRWAGSNSRSFVETKLPCSGCTGCRLKRSAQWAIRCVHEASLYELNCFITLTFSPEFLETRSNQWSLDYDEWRLFMMRFRKRFGPGLRYYHCGEYGKMCAACDRSLFYCRCSISKRKPILGRPHYHACLFGFDFPDKEFFKMTDGGYPLYISKELDRLWTDPKTKMPMGFSTIGDLTFESAAYCARYIVDKINGDLADQHYFRFDTGEILEPEYTTMSRGSKKLGTGGIAKVWFDRFSDDVFPHDFIVHDGRKINVPRFYDNLLKAERPYTFDDVKSIRVDNAKLHVDNCTKERLAVREAVQLEQFRLLPRNKEF